ncbi:hypothetical protein ACQPZF_27480 [Actinosynnema sp. CS-041913]|uniref:hypothetical protein n=1 Tax=Actinosynnema sp. CS-041913 TaxID=3239917 RepID=UPI003D94809B
MTGVRDFSFGGPLDAEVDPAYARLRRHEPPARVRMPYGAEGWLATRHQDVRTVQAVAVEALLRRLPGARLSGRPRRGGRPGCCCAARLPCRSLDRAAGRPLSTAQAAF